MNIFKNCIFINIALITAALSGAVLFAAQGGNRPVKEKIKKEVLIKEIEALLNDDFRLWYPLSVDTVYGGFYSDINYKWERDGSQMKMIVTQARHLWSASNAAAFYSDNKEYLKIAAHAFAFLRDVMWDKENGGFFDLVTLGGKPAAENNAIIKRAYGNAFAIYGLAAYYKVSGDTSALNLAIKTFFWLEKCSFDPVNGGYYQFISCEGRPFADGFRGTCPKDQNSSIHILECFTELYEVWPDKLLKERLSSMLCLIRDKMTSGKGCLNLYFDKQFKPLSHRDSSEEFIRKNVEMDHVSFGHDIETAYLMLEASGALGYKNDKRTLEAAKKMVDHSIENGWDDTNGGFYDGGFYFKECKKLKIVKESKEWWVHAEALNTFLMMAQLYPQDHHKYYDKFTDQWNYIKNFLVDKDYGGWYYRGIDNRQGNKFSPKATIWKCNYHTSRSLINCLRRLSGKTYSKQYIKLWKNNEN